MMRLFAILAAVSLLAACGEKEQTSNSSYKPDEKAWQSSGSPYHAANYKGGDKAAWESQMRNRIQSQNEYVRSN